MPDGHFLCLSGTFPVDGCVPIGHTPLQSPPPLETQEIWTRILGLHQ